MNFKSYCDIENSYRQKTLDYIVQQGMSGGIWCVTCKVHGSNNAWLSDGQEVRFAKRGCVLGDDDNFYGCQNIKGELTPKINAAHALLKEKIPTLNIIQVCGEIFGGWYPHIDVPKNSSAVRVQKGIYYSPNNGFYAFDIMADGIYQNYDTCIEIFEKVGLFHAKILFSGTLQECLDYPNAFQTKIPGWLGLPEIVDNICEGVVLKPIENKHLICGSRVILKNKNERWSEKMKKPQVKTEIKFDDNTQKIFDEINELITENRLRNVLSKIGEITQKDFGKIMGEFQKDLWIEYRKDNAQRVDDLSKEQNKRIQKLIGQMVSNLIRTNFQDIVDKVF